MIIILNLKAMSEKEFNELRKEVHENNVMLSAICHALSSLQSVIPNLVSERLKEKEDPHE
jgi:hypothetical protein